MGISGAKLDKISSRAKIMDKFCRYSLDEHNETVRFLSIVPVSDDVCKLTGTV
jgi:hypothetical protein